MRAPDVGPVAVVTALEEELAGIRRFVSPSARLVLAATGDGPSQAARRAAEICDRHRPSALIGAGVAGALSADIAAGEILISRAIRDGAGLAPPPDPALLARAAALPGALLATLLTVSTPALTRAQKAALEKDAGGSPAAVDMESSAWARQAAARGIPYLVIRVVCDTANEELPEYLARCIGRDGGIRRGAVVVRALASPSSWGTLLRMRRRLHECAPALGAFLRTFLEENTP